jgi:hypothetical protein
MAGTEPLVRGVGFGAINSARLQVILNAALTGSTSDKSIYYPIGRFQLSSTVTVPNANSFRMFGGGGMCKSLSQMAAKSGACTYLEWTGGTSGPMFQLQNSEGDVWEYLNFDGVRGPDTNVSGVGLDVLIKQRRPADGSGALWHHWKNCTFFRAQRLFWAANDAESIGTAEYTFSKCMFNCGETSVHRWTSQAFYSDNPQCVNTLFDSNCEFNNCGYAAYCVNTGRVTIRNPTVAIVGTLLLRDGGSQNTAGDSIEYPHLDGGLANEGRKALYKSINSSSTHGNVKIIIPKYGAVGSVTDEFANIDSFSGISLSLIHPVRMRVGDKVAFVRKDDRSNVNGGKVETEIFIRTNDTTYATTATSSSLGFVLGSGETIANAYDCCNGEALVTCVSSESIHIDGGFFSLHHMRAGRLARLTHSSFSTGRSPKFVASRTMGHDSVNFNSAGLERLLTKTGTVYWRFEDADQIDDGAAPITVGNFGVVSSSVGDTVIKAETETHLMRKYAQLGIEVFTLYDPATGEPKSGITFEAGDVKLSKDGGALANTINLPAAVGSGVYALTLTAAERTASQAHAVIKDQTVPIAFSAKTLHIDTYGNDLAQHKVDLNETNIAANLKAVDGNADAVAAMKRAGLSMAIGTVAAGSSVTNIITSGLTPAPTVQSQFKNRIVLFPSSTLTAGLRGKQADITESNGSGVLTVSGLTVAPAENDVLVIV